MEITKSRVLTEKAQLSQSDINSGYEYREYDDGKTVAHYIVSDAVNRHLRSADIELQAKEEPYEIPERFRRYSIAIVNYPGLKFRAWEGRHIVLTIRGS